MTKIQAGSFRRFTIAYLRVVGAAVMAVQSCTTLPAQTSEYLSELLHEAPTDLYGQLLKEKLITSSGDCGVMVMMPTGFGEWAVSASTLRSRNKNASSDYRLCLTSAATSLYESRFGSDRTKDDVRIKEVCVEIDQKFARAIQRAWRAILSKEPPPSSEADSSISLDGCVADFSVKMQNGKKIARRTLNPSAPPASQIVNLGYLLRDYCLGSAHQREERRYDVIDKLNKFSDQWDTSNSKSK